LLRAIALIPLTFFLFTVCTKPRAAEQHA